MMRNALPFICVMLSVVVRPALAEPDSAAADSERTQQLVNDTLELVELVLEHHVQPPTRQEMVLSIARFVYGADVPSGLSRHVSDAVDRDDLRAILEAAFAGREKLSLASLQFALNRVVSGGISILAAEEQRVQSQFDSNRYVGTGIALAVRDRPIMQKVFPGGPAAKIGARDGDQILDIDGTDTAGLDIQEVIKLLRGPDGSPVTVVLQQPGDSERRTLTIVRGVVPFQHAHYEVVGSGDNPRIAHVKVERISASTVHELEQFGKRFEEDGIEGLLLDLTMVVPETGTIHHAVLLADALLDDQPIGVVRTGSGDELRRSAPGELFPELPISVLVGPYTSGTAEWVAAALEDSGRATRYGGRTAGDVTVQEALTIGDGSQVIRLATAELRRADNSPIEGRQGQRGRESVHIPQVTIELPKAERGDRQEGPAVSQNPARVRPTPTPVPIHQPLEADLNQAIQRFQDSLRKQP